MGWDVYWLSVLDGMRTLWVLLGILTGVVSFVALFIFAAEVADRGDCNHNANLEKLAGVGLCVTAPTMLLCMVLCALTPSTETLVRAYALRETAKVATAENAADVAREISAKVDVLIEVLRR